MKITEFWKKGKFTYSAELLPPKRDPSTSEDSFEETNKILEKGIRLMGHVDFISITMGAGGKIERSEPFLLASLLREHYNGQGYDLECIPHLTCLNSSKSDIDKKIDSISGFGLENILVLRGDVPDIERKQKKQQKFQDGEFRYAGDLVAYISESKPKEQFCIGVAAYPNGYNEDGNIDHAIDILKTKINAGAEYAITQMIFDADVYGKFLERATEQDLDIEKIPILAGVCLIESYKQCEHLTDRFNVKIPFMDELAGKSKEESKEITAKHIVQLCKDLKDKGAPGIHLFTLNNTCFARKVLKELRNTARRGQ